MSNNAVLYELQQRIAQLTPEDQMKLMERVLAKIRTAHFHDHEADERAMDEMMVDPDFQRVLNNQDLPYPGAEAKREAG